MNRAPVLVVSVLAGAGGVLAAHAVASGHRPLASATTAAGQDAPLARPAASARSPNRSATSTKAAAPKSRREELVAGAREQYGYGVLAVRLTVRAGKILGVSVPFLQTADSYSQSLADYVFPVLRREVLSAQSARIDGVTGATYTSEAYALSVQSALDRLKRG